MRFYRCLICGEVYFGREAPSHCPACGALDTYIVPLAEWVDEDEALGEISEKSRANLVRALQLEANNAPFYRDASRKAKNPQLQAIFKYLTKVEAAHAWTISKILGTQAPPPEPGKEVAGDDERTNIVAAHAREVAATSFYQRATSEATEPRVQRVFAALSDVETDHHRIEAELLKGL